MSWREGYSFQIFKRWHVHISQELGVAEAVWQGDSALSALSEDIVSCADREVERCCPRCPGQWSPLGS